MFNLCPAPVFFLFVDPTKALRGTRMGLLFGIIWNLILPPWIEQRDRHKRPASWATITELQQTRQAGHHKSMIMYLKCVSEWQISHQLRLMGSINRSAVWFVSLFLNMHHVLDCPCDGFTIFRLDVYCLSAANLEWSLCATWLRFLLVGRFVVLLCCSWECTFGVSAKWTPQ